MKAAEIARSMEADAVAFYTEAASKTAHPMGKRIFLSIAEDERRHMSLVEALLKGLDITASTAGPIGTIKSVFEQHREELSKRLAATTDEKSALKTAMDMEAKGRDFYKKAASEAKDPKAKSLFAKLASEEEEHYRVFSNTLAFLNDTGNWFMWEERGIVEG